MRILITVLFLLTFGVSIGQVYNPTPQYVFKNKLGVGRSTPVDSAAYMNVGPNGGAVAGIMLPRIADTLTISGTKRHGLLIFSNQLNKFAWYDSTNTRWVEVGSGSGTSGGEVMLMNGSGTVGDSLLFTTITGDTAYVRNLLAGSGLLFENMGDTVLKLNIDSSTSFNIYNSDGSLKEYREVTVDSTGYIAWYLLNTGDGDPFFEIQASDQPTLSAGNRKGYFEIGRGQSQLYAAPNSIYGDKQNGVSFIYDPSGNKYSRILAMSGLFISPGTADHGSYSSQDLDTTMPITTSNDTAMYWNPSTGQVMRTVDKLTGSATLDFPSTGSGAVADLTVTVTGASVGDVVSVGVPNGSVTATATYWGWVSATDTVTVRFSPKATEDPASGTFKIKVFK